MTQVKKKTLTVTSKALRRDSNFFEMSHLVLKKKTVKELVARLTNNNMDPLYIIIISVVTEGIDERIYYTVPALNDDRWHAGFCSNVLLQ